MQTIVAIIEGPGLTDEGAIGRVVKFADGTGEVQTYREGQGWVMGGTDLGSLSTAGGVDEELLKEEGYSKEDIENIFAGPDPLDDD